MTSPFPQITSPPQASAEVIVNEALETLKHEAVYGKDQSTTTGLIWGYYGGRWGGFSVADGTFTLTDASANYIVVERATGATTCSTSATHWNDTVNYARVYKLTTAGGVVTAEEDHRAGPGGAHGGAGGAGGGGSLAGLEFAASSTTTDSDPGTGTLRWNNATQASATSLYVDNADADSTSLVTFWAALGVGSFVKITDGTNADVWQLWKVNATPINGTGYYKFPVTLEAQEGGNIANGTVIFLDVDSSGSSSPLTTKGDTYGRSSSADVRIPVGPNYSHVIADSAATPGLKYVLQKAVPLAFFGTLANDGTTDDSAVLTAALASGVSHIDARGLNLAIPSQISLVAGVTLDISGTTITTAGSTISTFKADSIDDWHLIAYGATIIGAGTTTGSAKGVSVIQCNRYSVRGLRCKNIKGHGFFVAPGTLSTPRGDQGLWIDCFAESCFWGWEDTPGTGAEYNIVTNLRTSGCTTWGVKTSAGNVAWHGGHDIDNVGDGFVMVGGANHAHGIVTGRSCNHNGTNNLSLTGIVNGQTFVGCHFYEKIILLDGCKGVVFVGGAIDTPTITVNSGTGSGQCVMIGVYFPGDYASPPAVGGTAPSSLARWNCTGPGAAPSWIGPRQSICIACGDETTAITAATGKVTFRMPFAFYVQEVRASVTTAPTGSGNLTVDINESGTSIISTKLTFDASEKTTTTAATPAVISDHDIADDAEITIDVDAVSGTITGAGLKVYLIGYPQAA